MQTTPEIVVLDKDRLAELWAEIQTALEGKADLPESGDYATPDAVAAAITAALTAYPSNEEVQAAITTALGDYMTASAVNDAIAGAVSNHWSKSELRVMTAEELQAILT